MKRSKIYTASKIRYWMMASEMLMMRGVIIGLLLLAVTMVPKTMQLPMYNNNNNVAERKFKESEYSIGLILSSPSDEKALLESGMFVLDDDEDYAILNKTGRTFYFGSINDVPIGYVVLRSPLTSVSLTTELLIWHTNIDAIIDFGNAATISDSVKLGDVAVISEAAFTSAWTWKERGSSVDPTKELPSLKFGDYNKPRPGDNKFGSAEYNKVTRYIPIDIWNRTVTETFWYSADPEFLEYASKLKDMDVLGRTCIGDMCTNASIVYGVRASTSDAYVQNSAYGRFLRKTLNVSVIDMKSAATIATISLGDGRNNKVNHVTFRAASNRPGEKKDPKISALARQNNLKVVRAFIELLVNESSSTSNYVL